MDLSHKAIYMSDDSKTSNENRQALRRSLFYSSNNIAWLQLLVNRWQLITSSILNFTLIIVTGVLVYYTRSLDSSTRRLSESTDNLRDYSFDQIRPYVTIQSIDTDPNSIKDDFDISVLIKNSGISPSYETVMFRKSFIAVYNDEHSKNYSTDVLDTDCSKYDSSLLGTIPLGQNDTKKYGVVKEINKYRIPSDWDKVDLQIASDGHFLGDDLKMLKSGKATLVINGIACYKDILKKYHYTRFCRAYHYDEIQKNKSIYGDLCSVGNDAD